MTTQPERRLPELALVTEHLEGGVSSIIPVDGSRPLRFVIDAAGKRLGVRVPAEGPEPPVARYESVSSCSITEGATVWHEVTIGITVSVDDVYYVVTALADRIQLENMPLAEAVQDTLSALQSILAARAKISFEKEIGLFGELFVLASIQRSSLVTDALDVWLGPSGEEHDFSVNDSDFEVKTTTDERRKHWISTATQLLPKPGRPLRLVSVQLTKVGGQAGFTLPELVTRVRSLLPAPQRYDEALSDLGYRAMDSDLYTTRWALRDEPACFDVVDDFPALTQPQINSLITNSSQIIELRYRIDVTDLEEAEQPFPFTTMEELGAI